MMNSNQSSLKSLALAACIISSLLVAHQVNILLQPQNTIEYGNYGSVGITKQKPVVILTVKWCRVCQNLKDFLGKNNIDYIEYDVEGSSRGSSLFTQYDAKSYPVVFTKNALFRGFHPTALKQQLKTTISN